MLNTFVALSLDVLSTAHSAASEPEAPWTPYLVVIFLHSWLRLAVFIAGAGALLAAARTRSFEDSARVDRWSRALIVALDVQLLVGVVLYVVLSPVTRYAMGNVGGMFRDPDVRFYSVDHPLAMIAAVAIAHVGWIRGRKAATADQKRRTLLFSYGLSLVLILALSPWPNIPPGRRPLLRIEKPERD